MAHRRESEAPINEIDGSACYRKDLTVTRVDAGLGVELARIAAVPQPAEYALLLAGLALVGAAS